MRIGIDVGGTNTDSVLIDNNKIINSFKTNTSEDISSSVKLCISKVLQNQPKEKIKSIIADSFDLPYDEVTLDTGPSNTVSWDSFGQMDLVLNIEKEFDITLEFDEIFKIVSTQTLLEVVEDKLNESQK